ncbi:PLP-dependent aminotransferase family protein [Micromonospora sp. NPDC051925]|uniref:PLP-dependent aminotransferase family protein n=1 Tax=Micromonospora sp. NPDC051925 TaxID=3364288 RepID=UPI0037CBEAE2
MRHRENLTFAIELDRGAPRPLQEQLADQLCAAIDAGTLARHTRMPSTRTLGTLLRVSRGVTVAAYDLLYGRGYVEGRTGSGTYVAARGVPGPTAGSTSRPPAGRASGTDDRSDTLIDFTPGLPCAEAFPLTAWRAAGRRASYHAPPSGPLPPLGLPQLRQAITAHLDGTRRTVPAGHEVVVTAGVGHSLRVVLEALGSRCGSVAVEDPMPPALRRAVDDTAGQVSSLPVDEQGVRLDGVAPDCDVLVLTADAQLPLGHVLSATHRRDTVDWAVRTGGHVVEIACDAVPRPDAARLPRLLDAADGAGMVLVGGFAELLTPALNLGYAVVPSYLARRLRAHLTDSPEQPSYLTQLAIAHLLADGTLTRLMRRLVGLHARKRELVLAALAPLRGRVELFALDAVGTVGLRLPDGPDVDTVTTELAGRGLLVPGLCRYQRVPRPDAALVLGYAHLPDSTLRAGLARLVDALGGA